MRSSYVILSIVIVCCSARGVSAQAAVPEEGARADSSQYARQLSSSDPATRQAAAEGLARLAALEQRKLVEGYVLEEKDKHVRLALNWALYRMGKREALFQIVRELDSVRFGQALDYLTQLETPDPLYLFLTQENTPPRVTQRLLEVLGESGNAETVEKIKPFLDHYDPRVSGAARVATGQIENRQAQPKTDVKTRPRVVTKSEEPLR